MGSLFITVTTFFPILLSTAALMSLLFVCKSVDAKPLQQNQVRFRRLPPKQFSAPPGSSITIECEAGASPPPAIHWLKDGKRIIQSAADEENQIEDNQQTFVGARLGLSATRSRLFIDCASDLDEATYTCVAENAYSRISSHTKFTLKKPIAISENEVQQDIEESQTNLAGRLQGQASRLDYSGADQLAAVPRCLTEAAKSSQEPVRINMWSHNMVESASNDIVIFCRSNKVLRNQQSQLTTTTTLNNDQHQDEQLSSKLATVTWTLPNDKQVTSLNADKYEILSTGDLLIKNLQWSDMGSFVCTVSDNDSLDSVSTFIYPIKSKVEKTSTTSNNADNNR